jgi:hypothetical protein
MLLAAFEHGRGQRFMAEARRHPPCLARAGGRNGEGRKGSAWSSLRCLLERVDKHCRCCTASGLSSGEG